MLFVKKSEKLMHQIDQLELELEELYIARCISQGRQPEPVHESSVKAPTPKRHWLDTLPREVQLYIRRRT
jgi:transposase